MEIILSFVILALIMMGMAVGVIFANKPIKGSCGGMSAIGIDTACDICGGNPKKCDEEQERVANEKANTPAADLAYDASESQK